MISHGSDQNVQQVEEAYANYGNALFSFALRLTGHREDAEDIVVETFAHAYRQWGAFRGAGSRRTWLFGIAINRFRMSKRRERPITESLDDEILQSQPHAVDIIALEMEILSLPTKQREAFLLVKDEGLTAREAAEILSRPVGTILYDVHRAVKALRKALDVSPVPPSPCEEDI
jgi:RNA polymerase sigma factor (sigma-70 family)